MKLRAIVIMLVVALLVVFTMAGAALAYAPKAPPVLGTSLQLSSDSAGYWISFDWSKSGAKPLYAWVERHASDGAISIEPIRLTGAQIGHRHARLGPFYGAVGDHFRVRIETRTGVRSSWSSYLLVPQ